jgi:uncharacterized protein (TIGR00725 family)
MKKTIAVFGSAVSEKDSPEYAAAVEIGRIIGDNGYDLLCGGYGGVMEAVCQGCHGAGGLCRGIGLDHFTKPPNRYINGFITVPTLGERLDYFVTHSDIFLALQGGIGTITEVMFVWDLLKSEQITEKPLLLYGPGWEGFLTSLGDGFIIDHAYFRHLRIVSRPDELHDLIHRRDAENAEDD